MVNTVNSSATTVAVGTVTEEILMEVDFCRERLRVGRDLWELWLYVGDLVLDFVAMVVVVLVGVCGKVQGGDPTAGLASMNPFVCFCGGFTERNGHKKCHERKIWAWWRSWSGLSFI